MINVVLAGTQLIAIVPDAEVFVYTDATDQTMRYAAWEYLEREKIKGAVFHGIVATAAGSSRCYVIIPNRVYNPAEYPWPCQSKAEDDRQAAEIMKTEKRAAARLKPKPFLMVPRCCGGVDYGASQRILIITDKGMLVYKGGSTCYTGRGERSYSGCEMRFYDWRWGRDYTDNEIKIVPVYSTGKSVELPKGWRFSAKGMRMPKIKIGVTLLLSNHMKSIPKDWDWKKTLDLRSAPLKKPLIND